MNQVDQLLRTTWRCAVDETVVQYAAYTRTDMVRAMNTAQQPVIITHE